MSNRERMIATLGMWFFITIVIAVGYDNPVGQDGGQLIGLAAILAIAGAVSTRYIWSGVNTQSQSSRPRSEKAKRSPQQRVDRLINALDDDELDALRQRLTDDDQPASLEELLSEYERD